MKCIANQYRLRAALPSDWSKADMRALNQMQRTLDKLNTQLNQISRNGVLVEVKHVAIHQASFECDDRKFE